MQRQMVGVKREKIDTDEALIKTTQLKRRGDRELDTERKKLRATEDQLEQKTEQLDQLNCISCEEARATVAYLPCFMFSLRGLRSQISGRAASSRSCWSPQLSRLSRRHCKHWQAVWPALNLGFGVLCY